MFGMDDPLKRWAKNQFTVGAGRADTMRGNFGKLDPDDSKNKALDKALDSSRQERAMELSTKAKYASDQAGGSRIASPAKKAELNAKAKAAHEAAAVAHDAAGNKSLAADHRHQAQAFA